MRTRTLLVLAALVALPAFAQVEVSIQLPSITFSAPPPLVVVEPGVQVVEDNDEEVFFVNESYWVRRGPRWYRAKDHRGGWVVVDGPGVPPSLVRMPEGKYRRYKHGKAVVIDPPGPGKVKVEKMEKHKGGKHRD
jgi:hypothetical protein